MNVKTDHWHPQTIKFLKPVLAQAHTIIRIATGFFTVEGYDSIRELVVGKHVRLMVGYDEASRERLREKLIDDIMRYLSTWDASNRRAAVQALVAQLEAGRLQVVEQQFPPDVLDARLRSRDHAKVFIVDDIAAVIGSGNLTVNGMRRNIEAMTTVTDPAQLAYWVQQFEHYWNAEDTVDLTQALLEALLAWLGLHPPYDVYLKTIEALIGEDDTEPPRDDYKMPVQYQLVVIERVLRQLNDWGGAMLVASTGLGKTVMATHIAYRLREARKIFKVIVFAPLQTLPNWKDAMDSAGVACDTFTRNLLDQRLSKRTHEVKRMVSALEKADDKCIIFVDESHHFKNMLRAKDGKPRHSFLRLFEAVNERGAKIVLLTATPLAKGVDDLNNQLYLLPHSAEPSYINKNGQFTIPGFRDDEIHPEAWKVKNDKDFFDRFINLPVSTVISTSQVAKDFAAEAPDGDYVEFPHGRKWIPRIEIKKIKVPVPLEAQLSRAIRQDYFKHKIKKFQNRGVWQWSEVTIQKVAEVAWTSSPLALQEVVRKTLDGTYDEEWIRSIEAQSKILQPILEQLDQFTSHHDEKFLTLCRYLEEAYQAGRKTVIFTERHATAVYLAENLARHIPQLSIACSSRKTETDYELRDFDKEVLPMIKGFAPEANADLIDSADELQPYDVFIATDAYSTGVNLQDASIVINYDLAWTPDTIIQRAGRVLRLWKEPRLVSLYVFVGDFQTDEDGRTATQGVVNRLRTLSSRSEQAQQFSELPVFSDKDDSAFASLSCLSKVTIEDLGLADITEIEEFTGVSGFLRHITVLKQNQDYAEQTPDDISSALAYSGERHLLYLLLRHHRTYHWMLYDIERQDLENVKEDRLLNLIRCQLDTEVAPVNADDVERYAQACRNLWLKQHPDYQSEEVERICALYLLPYHVSNDMGDMLKAGLAN